MKKIEDHAEWVTRLDNLGDEEVKDLFSTHCTVALAQGQYRIETDAHWAALVVDGRALGFPFSDAEKVEKERQLDAIVEALGCEGWTYDQNSDVVFEGPEDFAWCGYDSRNPFCTESG